MSPTVSRVGVRPRVIDINTISTNGPSAPTHQTGDTNSQHTPQRPCTDRCPTPPLQSASIPPLQPPPPVMAVGGGGCKRSERGGGGEARAVDTVQCRTPPPASHTHPTRTTTTTTHGSCKSRAKRTGGTAAPQTQSVPAPTASAVAPPVHPAAPR